MASLAVPNHVKLTEDLLRKEQRLAAAEKRAQDAKKKDEQKKEAELAKKKGIVGDAKKTEAAVDPAAVQQAAVEARAARAVEERVKRLEAGDRYASKDDSKNCLLGPRRLSTTLG